MRYLIQVHKSRNAILGSPHGACQVRPLAILEQGIAGTTAGRRPREALRNSLLAHVSPMAESHVVICGFTPQDTRHTSPLYRLAARRVLQTDTEYRRHEDIRGSSTDTFRTRRSPFRTRYGG